MNARQLSTSAEDAAKGLRSFVDLSPGRSSARGLMKRGLTRRSQGHPKHWQGLRDCERLNGVLAKKQMTSVYMTAGQPG